MNTVEGDNADATQGPRKVPRGCGFSRTTRKIRVSTVMRVEEAVAPQIRKLSANLKCVNRRSRKAPYQLFFVLGLGWRHCKAPGPHSGTRFQRESAKVRVSALRSPNASNKRIEYGGLKKLERLERGLVFQLTKLL